MKLKFLCLILFALTQNAITSYSQNISINILTQNAGVVTVGGTVLLEVQVCNTGTIATPTFKVRPQISVPANVTIAATGHTLPAGWTVVSNSGSVIRICNGTDNFGAGICRTALIVLQGTTAGASSTITGQLTFANGSNCSISGAATSGDNSADNSSTSTVTVSGVAPVTLTNFAGKVVNCQPSLSWETEDEVNSDRFEIERANLDNMIWRTVGTIAARGNSNTRSLYKFIDTDVRDATDNVVYRLKMIDRDATFKFSGTLSLKINCKTLSVNVYPNPVADAEIKVNVKGASGKTEGILFSPTGQVVKRWPLQNGINTVDISNLPDGMYLLDVKDKTGNSEKIKVTVQK